MGGGWGSERGRSVADEKVSWWFHPDMQADGKGDRAGGLTRRCACRVESNASMMCTIIVTPRCIDYAWYSNHRRSGPGCSAYVLRNVHSSSLLACQSCLDVFDEPKPSVDDIFSRLQHKVCLLLVSTLEDDPIDVGGSPQCTPQRRPPNLSPDRSLPAERAILPPPTPSS